MAEKQLTEEEAIKHEKKMTGYLSLFNFLLAFLVGYYYGMHYAAIIAAFLSLFIGYTRASSTQTIWKRTWALASPYVMIIGVGVINPSVIPVGVSGALFTLLGLHLSQMERPVWQKGILMAGALALSVYGALIEYPRYVQNVLSTEVNKAVDSFNVVDLQGNTVYSEDLHGKVVLIDFWATWCKPCRDEFVELEKVYQKFEGNENVVFLITNAKNSGDTAEGVKQFSSNSGFNLPFVMDLSGTATRAFEVGEFPTLALIDKNGQVRLTQSGFSNAEELSLFLENKINQLLNE